MSALTERLYDDLFADMITVIPLSDEEYEASWQRELGTMWQRITALRCPTNDAIENEATASPIAVSIPDSTEESDESIDSILDDIDESKEIKSVNTSYGVFDVPIPKIAYIGRWQTKVNHFMALARYRIRILCEFEGIPDRTEPILKMFQDDIKRINWNIKNAERTRMAKNILVLQMCESMIFTKVGKIADGCKNVNFTISEFCKTVSVKGEREEDVTFLQSMATKHHVLQRNYQLTPESVGALIRSLFSSDPFVRAQAKLELNSKLNETHYRSVIRCGPSVLEAVFSEARLTSKEILGVIFEKRRDGVNTCVSCGTSVNLDDTLVYHNKCIVVEWLTQHCHFRYETQGGYLHERPAIILSALQRARLHQILRLNAMLSVDVHQRTQGGLTIWERQPSGRLHKKTITTMREDQIVGSQTWLRNHGMVKP